jgi:diguanylate cyclase (GGDEF)-like protein
MFRSGRSNDQSRIRLPRQTVAPGMKELQSLYDQAKANRGREVELVWQVPGTYKSYSLHVKFDRVTPHPLWNVWEDNGRESKMVWRFETSDLNMIYDVIAMLEVSHQKTTGTVQTIGGGGFSPSASGTFSSSGGPVYQTGSQSYNPNPPGYGGAGTDNQSLMQPAGSNSNFQGGSMGQTGARPVNVNDGWRNVAEELKQAQQAGAGGQPQQGFGGVTGSFTQPQQGFAGGSSQQGFGAAAGSFNQPQQGFSGAGQAQQGFGAAGGFTARPQAPLSPPGGLPEGALPVDFFSDAPATIAAPPKAVASIEGVIEQNPLNNVMTTIGMQQLTGKLEVIGESSVGHVYFESGIPKDAQTATNRGDDAIKELVTWRRGSFLFKGGLRTEMRSVEKSLQTSVMEGLALLDQLKHLEKAGLVYESVLVQKQKNLGEPELRLMLAKGHPVDFVLQKAVYDSLAHKMTFTDLLRDKPMEQTQWAPLLFNLLYCGLIEIKAPMASRGGALDFLGDNKQVIQNLAYNFKNPETGIYTSEALLFFMEYEYYRYEAYSWPLALVVFDLCVKRTGSSGIVEADPLGQQALQTAVQRIDLVKRPLDFLTHFQNNEFAILMPNTKASQASFVANRILDALTVTPLAPGIDKANLGIAFGIANLPSDGEDLEVLLQAAAHAKAEAREGTFPIVLARTSKRD